MPTRPTAETPAEAPRPTRRKRRFSRPELHIPVTLRSAHAQKVGADGNMIRVARALYTIDVILHAIGDADDADRVEGVVDGLLAAFAEKLAEETATLRTEREDSGVRHLPVYESPLSLTFRISSPQLARYAELVRGLDALAYEADALWLNGLLSNRRHSRLAYTWRTELFQLGRKIGEIERLARASAFGSGHEAEIAAGEEEAERVVTVEEGQLDDDGSESQTSVAQDAEGE